VTAIAVVDYGLGNLGSVLKAFRHVGAPAELTADPAVLRRAEALVLPGDAAFGTAMDEIRGRGLDRLIGEAAAEGRWVLGICIGMQVLFEESSEHGRHRGLGLLDGRVRRLETGLPVPHMGWNRLRWPQPHPLMDGIEQGRHVYFVHSYFCDAAPGVVVATTDYGRDFAAVVARDNVLGVQFHPEKSQAAGLRLIENVVRLAAGGARVRPSAAAARGNA
jgi:imidazole glycerol-phosphate synthase subunit HisH